MGLPKGSAVYALEDGQVLKSYSDPTGGEMIVVKTRSGNTIRYLHMEAGTRAYKMGDTITRGAVIGKVGSTGQSTGPHLHIDVQDKNGKYVNPANWL